MLKPFGEVVASPYEIQHTEEAVGDLTERILSLGEETRVVMEATGAYHLPLLLSLKERGIFVSVINPLAMKKYATTSIRKGKTDKMDSVRIASYGLDNWLKLDEHKPPEAIYAELNALGRQYNHYITVKVSCALALTNLLDRAMPGIKQLLPLGGQGHSPKDKLCDFAEEYWHYDNIARMSENRFVNAYNRWAKKKGYHPSEAKAKAIYALVTEGIPTLPSNAASTKTMMMEAVRVLKEVNRTLATILSQMWGIAVTLPEYDTVRAMRGVGDVLAPRLIAEIGDVRRFKNGSSLVAHAGIDSPPFQSGAFVGTRRKISKRGSASLRKTGYEVMRCLKTSKPEDDNAVYLFILKKEAEGKPKKVAKIAGLNKFLRIYYARVMEVYK